MSSPLLKFDAVTLRRGGRLLFEDLSLAVRAGEGLHLSGPNGAGKSSLLRLAAGLLRADRGQVGSSAVTMADDGLALDPELPLGRALNFWSTLGGYTSNLDHALEALGLAGLADVPVRLLSAGQRKRATLARAAASGAPLWLLDEPLNGLDSASAERLSKLLIAHRTAGGAIVAASHVPLPGQWAILELGR